MCTRRARGIRFIQHGRFRGSAVRRNLQPAQFRLQFRNALRLQLGVKIVENQLIDFAAAGKVIHVTRGRDQQFKVVIQMHGLLMKISLAVLEPADHPLINRFPADQGSSVRARPDEESDLVLRPVNAVPMAGFLVNHPSARGREVVILGFLNQPGRGRGDFHKIRHIEPVGQKLGKRHFRIGVRAGKEQLVGIGIAGRNDRL